MVEANEESERKRLNRLKEYEKQIMYKSDELKKQIELEQKENRLKHENDLDLVLNDCERIATHKRKFSD